MTRASVLGVAGLLLTFTAPAHRPDLLAFGVLATAAALIWQPRSGPLLIGASLPFYFFSRQLVGPLSVSPPGLTLLLAWLGTAVQGVRGRITLRLPRSSYDAPLALFLAAALLGLLVSEYPLLSARELRALIFEPVLFFWLLRCMPGSSRLALGGFLAAATLVALSAVVQVGLGIGGTEAEGVRRAQAWYPSPNHMALMLGRAWPFLLALALARSRVAAVPAVLVGVAMLLSFSTGAWLGLVVATIVTLAVLGRRRLAVAVGAVLAAGLVGTSALAVVGALPERLNPLRQTGGFRVDLWVSSLQMLRDHPILGVGLDNFVYQYQDYVREGAVAEPNLSHPHNWLLNFWLEMGLPGLVAFCWLVVTFVRRALRARTWQAAGALGAIADMLSHGLIDNSYFLVDLAFLFWLTLSVLQEPD